MKKSKVESFKILPSIIFSVITVILFAVHAVSSFDCSPSFTDITCECTSITSECFGTQTDILQAEEILSNFSSKENISLKIYGLEFDSDFTFENHTVKNLTLGYGLQITSPNFFSGLSSSLISLNLQNVSFRGIENDVFTLLSLLKELVLDSNELYNLTTNMLTNLKEIKFLKIINNSISYIKPEYFQNLLHLEELILSHNKISLLENVNINSISLKQLKIDNCLIEGLLSKDTFAELPAIEILDISHNKILGIESHSLSTLKNLKNLNLSFNAIDYLEENAFTETRNLTYLDLSNNKISVIKLTSFAKLWNLKYLNLSGNKLKAVLCEYTTDFASLESISLKNNEIKAFTPGAFFYSSNLKVLDMEGNNLECSCSLTSSFHYLIENSTMESKDLETISCVIQSTGSQSAIIDYKSSKCIPVEPCKKPDVTKEEEEEEYDYDDEENSTSTVKVLFTTFSSTDTSLDDSTTIVDNTTNSLVSSTDTSIHDSTTTIVVNTTNSLVSSTDTSIDDSTTTAVVNTTNSLVSSTDTSIADSTTAIISSTINNSVSITDTSIDDSTLISTTNSSVSSTEKEREITTVQSTTLLLNTSKTNVDEGVSDSTTKNLTTNVSSTSTSTQSSIKMPLTSPTSMSKCSSLQLSTETAGSKSDIVILKNFSYVDSMFCLKWTVGGIDAIKTRCSIKYTTQVGTKVLNLVCPSAAFEVKEWSINERVFKFCLAVYPENLKKHDSCALLVSGRTTVTTHLPIAITGERTAETGTPNITFQKSTTSLKDSHSTTPILFKDTSRGILSSETTSSFSVKSTEINKIYPDDFFIKTFEVYFNDSKLAFTRWAVNKQQLSDDCNLTLKISTQYFDEIEGIFPCKNNTYRLKKVKEHDTFKVCLFSYHKTYGKDLICRHTLPSAKASTNAEDSSYSSLIPLICLLILLGIIVIFIVFKNILKNKTKSKYDVRKEEEKYQERVKIRPESSHEETVRFSYIAKTNNEYI